MAGAGYKLFTTGQVLTAAEVNTYLQEQVIMVFNDATARTTALSGVLAEGMVSYLKSTKVVEIYNGTAWASLDDPNAIQNTIVDAKGDLISASGNDVPARLAVGNDGESIVADSSASTGLRWQPSQAAGRNFVINGNFDIWQRGTSFASVTGYWADRWNNQGIYSAVTASQQTSGAPDGSRYYARFTSTGASSYWSNYHKIETANTSLLWGRTVTLSIKFRRNATFNSTGMTVYLEKSATVDAGSGAAWNALGSRTNIATASIPTGTTSADWATATVTTTVPNDGTANTIQVVIEYNGAAQNGSVIEIAQVQLEVGSVPTQFSRAGGTLAGELAACNYYFKAFGGNQVYDPIPSFGTSRSTTTHYINVALPRMRTTPSLSYSAITDWQVVITGLVGQECSNLALSTSESGTDCVLITATTPANANLGSDKFVKLVADNTTAARLYFSAEL